MASLNRILPGAYSRIGTEANPGSFRFGGSSGNGGSNIPKPPIPIKDWILKDGIWHNENVWKINEVWMMNPTIFINSNIWKMNSIFRFDLKWKM